MKPFGYFVYITVLCRVLLCSAFECPSAAWKKSGSTCYMLTTGLFSQTECSSSICGSNNATLVSIQSEYESISIHNLFPSIDNAWVGYYLSPITKRFTWSSKNEFSNTTSFTNWAPGEPNNYCKEESCVAVGNVLYPSGNGVNVNGYLWLDIDCRVTSRCLCQWPSVLSSDYISSLEVLTGSSDSPPPYTDCEFPSSIIVALLVLSILCCCSICLAVCATCSGWVPANALFKSTFKISHPLEDQPQVLLSLTANSMVIQCPSAATWPGAKLQVVGFKSQSPLFIHPTASQETGQYIIIEDDASQPARSHSSMSDNPMHQNVVREAPTIAGSTTGYQFPWYFLFRWARSPRRDELSDSRSLEMGNYCCSLSDPLSVHRILRKASIISEDDDNNNKGNTTALPKQVNTEAFTCIRGMGALQVFLGHFFAYFAKTNEIPLAAKTQSMPDFGGGSAVLMFFIMSGFLMMVGYATKPSVSAYNFLSHRVARLGPVYWLSVLLFVPFTIMQFTCGHGSASGSYVNGDSGLLTFFSYLTTLLFTQTWFVALGFSNINGPLWSIVSQFFCYAIFPYLAIPYLTVRNLTRLVGEVLLFWQIYVVCFVCLFVSSGYNYLLVHITPLNKLPLFIMGMILGSQALTNLSVVTTPDYQQRWGVICDLTTFFIAFYFLLQVVMSWTVNYAGISARLYAELFIPPVYALWLYSLTQAPKSLSYRVFCWWPFKRLGDYSFAVYCLHWPILTYYCWMRFGSDYFTDSDLGNDVRLYCLEVIPVLAIILIISAVVYHNLEQPSRVWLYAMISPRHSSHHSTIRRSRANADNTAQYEMVPLN